MDDSKRNPTIIPERPVAARGCPKCGKMEYGGRNVGGVITFTCRIPECRNQWQGGLPQQPVDPRIPRPPENPIPPPVTFTKNSKGMVVEELRPVNLTPEFRKGAPAPSGDEDV